MKAWKKEMLQAFTRNFVISYVLCERPLCFWLFFTGIVVCSLLACLCVCISVYIWSGFPKCTIFHKAILVLCKRASSVETIHIYVYILCIYIWFNLPDSLRVSSCVKLCFLCYSRYNSIWFFIHIWREIHYI